MLQVPAAIFSVLLVATGVAKLVRPHDTAKAIRQLGVPAPLLIVYALALLEVAVGAMVVTTMATAALVAQAALYLVFSAWVAVALRSDTPMASCGCLGRDDTPPSVGHLVVNVTAVAVSIGAIAGVEPWLGGSVGQTLASVSVVLIGGWLAWAIIGDRARIEGLIRQ